MNYNVYCFQSEILRTVNSTSSFNFVHLATKLWCLTFYGQNTIVFFDMMILLGEAVTSLLVAQIDFVAFKHKFVIMPDWPFFGCIL